MKFRVVIIHILQILWTPVWSNTKPPLTYYTQIWESLYWVNCFNVQGKQLFSRSKRPPVSKILAKCYVWTGVLFSCVALGVFRTLPGRTRIRLILPTRFLAFLFQIPHLLQCMKTRHNNPRHSYTGYLGIIILCIQTLWLHRLQGSPVQYCTASALWGSRPGRSSSRSATGIQRRCGTSSAGSCCTSTPARRWSPRCGSTARGCSTRPRRRSVTAPCFPDTCCSNTSPHHCKCCEEYTYFLIGALIS